MHRGAADSEDLLLELGGPLDSPSLIETAARLQWSKLGIRIPHASEKPVALAIHLLPPSDYNRKLMLMLSLQHYALVRSDLAYKRQSQVVSKSDR